MHLHTLRNQINHAYENGAELVTNDKLRDWVQALDEYLVDKKPPTPFQGSVEGDNRKATMYNIRWLQHQIDELKRQIGEAK